MPLNNFGAVVPGKLYRSAQPDEKGFEDIEALGITAIIKLDDENEYPLVREKELFSGIVWTASISVFFPKVDSVVDVAHKIDALHKAGHKVLVHCKHGRDRTGVAIGAWGLLFDRRSLKDVTEEFEEFGAVGIVKLADHELFEVLETISLNLSACRR